MVKAAAATIAARVVRGGLSILMPGLRMRLHGNHSSAERQFTEKNSSLRTQAFFWIPGGLWTIRQLLIEQLVKQLCTAVLLTGERLFARNPLCCEVVAGLLRCNDALPENAGL
jgi:hypothetical protein